MENLNGNGTNGAAAEGAEGQEDLNAGGTGDDQGQDGTGQGAEGAQGAGEQGQEGQGNDPTPPAEPEYVQDLRRQLSDLSAWRAEREKQDELDRRPKAPEPPKERTEEDWGKIEANFGITNRARQDENGNPIREISIDSRKLLGGIENFVKGALAELATHLESQIHENVSPFRMDPVFQDLASRRDGPLTDIGQYKSAIREYLKERYNPRDHSNPKYVEDAYWYAKGRGMKDVVRKIENTHERNRRVVQPAAGGSATQKKPVTGGSAAPADPAVAQFLNNWK